ncbi:MAG: LPS export ABC transporter periplasmic protein LptC [Gammaproteobacteria bacterium]|nr:LPS export ABC transporter periplasmic protein LptC [Gammaproteobacteria bacterium]
MNLLWKVKVPYKIKLNAISDIPLWVKILLPLVVLISLWLLNDETSQHETGQAQIHRTSDYGMTDFTMTIMNEFGQPVRVISGREMSHYPEDDSTEVFEQTTRFLDQQKDTWLVISDKGRTQGKGEDIFLTGNVIITRELNNEIELRTDILHIDTKSSTAYTDSAVEIKSPNGITHSVGLHAALEDKTVNLHSKVRGHYDAPPRN